MSSAEETKKILKNQIEEATPMVNQQKILEEEETSAMENKNEKMNLKNRKEETTAIEKWQEKNKD